MSREEERLHEEDLLQLAGQEGSVRPHLQALILPLRMHTWDYAYGLQKYFPYLDVTHGQPNQQIEQNYGHDHDKESEQDVTRGSEWNRLIPVVAVVKYFVIV